MKDLIRHSHCVGESSFHLQFTPAYRKDIFNSEDVKRLTQHYLLEKAEKLDVMITAIGFGPDHIHFFVGNCKNYSASQLARQFKGYISRMIRKDHSELFSNKPWGKKFWTSGYFYRGVGVITAESAEYYIQHSQQKHWNVVDYEVYMARQTTITQFFNP